MEEEVVDEGVEEEIMVEIEEEQEEGNFTKKKQKCFSRQGEQEESHVAPTS